MPRHGASSDRVGCHHRTAEMHSPRQRCIRVFSPRCNTVYQSTNPEDTTRCASVELPNSLACALPSLPEACIPEVFLSCPVALALATNLPCLFYGYLLRPACSVLHLTRHWTELTQTQDPHLPLPSTKYFNFYASRCTYITCCLTTANNATLIHHYRLSI